MSSAMSPLLGRLGLLLAPVLLCLALTLPAAAETPEPEVFTGVAFTINDPRITESSGLARDTDNEVFWTVNDSGDGGVVYAIGPDGRTEGTVEFDADPLDVEALAYVDRQLYVADIGDNGAERESVRIYVISSPEPGVDRGSNFTTYEFTYPDGPRDAEAILVDDSGQIRIVTKAATGEIYLAPRFLRTSEPNSLTRVGEAPGWVTDATVLPSGEYAVRTYLSVEILEPELYAAVARSLLPFQPQGESLTVSMADDALLIGSEGAESLVLRVPIPQTIQAEATSAPTPPPIPDASATAGVAVEPPVEGVNRSGTFVALGLAALVAIAAGLVVFLRDRDQEPPQNSTPRRQWEQDAPDETVQKPPSVERIDYPEQNPREQASGARPWDLRPPGKQRWSPGVGGTAHGGGQPPWHDDDPPTVIRRL